MNSEQTVELQYVNEESRDFDSTITVTEAAVMTGWSNLTVINRIKARDLVPVALFTYGRGRPRHLYDRTTVLEMLAQGTPRPRRAKEVVDVVVSE